MGQMSVYMSIYSSNRCPVNMYLSSVCLQSSWTVNAMIGAITLLVRGIVWKFAFHSRKICELCLYPKLNHSIFFRKVCWIEVIIIVQAYLAHSSIYSVREARPCIVVWLQKTDFHRFVEWFNRIFHNMF